MREEIRKKTIKKAKNKTSNNEYDERNYIEKQRWNFKKNDDREKMIN